MDEEQIIALAEEAKLFVVRNGDCDVEDLRRFLESYKAELLKEAGEPVAKVEQHARMTSQSTTLDRALRAGTTLYTSDQLASAIAKATKPLEEEIERLREEGNLPVRYYQPGGKGPVYAVYGSSSINFVEQLRAQLAAAREENGTLRKDAETYGPEKIAIQKQAWLEADRQRQINDLKDQLTKAEQRVAELIAELEHIREQKNLLWFEFSIATQQLAAAQEETRLLTERNATNEEYAANLVKALTKTQDQLAKAEQLWQIAQGRCDGLEEKLAKAEQRVAEACAYLAHQHMDADIAADAINNGEWRKFMKEN